MPSKLRLHLQAAIPQSEWIQCNVNPTTILALSGFFLAQICRSLGHAQNLAYFSVALLVVMSICILVAVTTTESTKGDGSPVNFLSMR